MTNKLYLSSGAGFAIGGSSVILGGAIGSNVLIWGGISVMGISTVLFWLSMSNKRNAWRSPRRPLTPSRGESMPQTREYWEKRAAMDQELILEQRDEINKLKQKINKLEQANHG